jgi:hypothetical protein
MTTNGRLPVPVTVLLFPAGATSSLADAMRPAIMILEELHLLSDRESVLVRLARGIPLHRSCKNGQSK